MIFINVMVKCKLKHKILCLAFRLLIDNFCSFSFYWKVLFTDVRTSITSNFILLSIKIVNLLIDDFVRIFYTYIDIVFKGDWKIL